MESVSLTQAKTTAALRAQGVTLASQNDQVKQIVDDLTAAKTDLSTTKTALTSIAIDIVGLHATIAELKAQVDAGGQVDLTALVAQADDLKATADDVLGVAQTADPTAIEAPVPPAVVPTPNPETPANLPVDNTSGQ